jgi:hypothetical protein
VPPSKFPPSEMMEALLHSLVKPISRAM